MYELPERSWKHRFTQQLACAFAARGIDGDGALEDAIAHADDHYPARGPDTPELEADVLHKVLLDDMDATAMSLALEAAESQAVQTVNCKN